MGKFSKRYFEHTILTKYGADCQTWIETQESSYPDEKGKLENTLAIRPNTPHEILLTEQEAKELLNRINFFLEGHP